MGINIPPQALLGIPNTWGQQNIFAAGTITTSQPLTLTQTWNAGGVTFTGAFLNFTKTASADGSKLLDIQLNSASKVGIENTNGTVVALVAPIINGAFGGNGGILLDVSSDGTNGAVFAYDLGVNVNSSGGFRWTSGNTAGVTADTSIIREAAAIVGSPGSLRIMNATSIPAGGTASAGYKFSSATDFGIFFGSGAPSLAAAKGSLYLRSDGSGVADRAYINTNGSTTWTAIATAG